MRFRSALVLLLPILFLWTPDASAQKRVFSKVNPNAAAINKTAEIYDPVTGKFYPATSAMNVPRGQHMAVALGGGRILIAGGYNNRYLRDVEIFDSVTGSFATADSMKTSRSGGAAVLIQGGRVLIVGGYNGSYISSAEYYDPSTGTFNYTPGYMVTPRHNPTATVLQDGNVLITGGFNGAFLNAAEIYNTTCTTCESFTSTSEFMSSAREGHAATLLSDGKVLITGGCNNVESDRVVCERYLDSAEIYDPTTGTFTDTTGTMRTPRVGLTASLLSNGKVLIAGGTNDGTSVLSSSEIYDPATGQFAAAGNMGSARIGHTATALSDGRILLAGGRSDSYLNSAEVFDPAAGTFSTVSSPMATPRYQHSATALGNGKVLFAGGQNSDLLIFDINYRSSSDNISPNIVISPDSKVGFVPYAGSGAVLAFSTETGAVIGRIVTGGTPAFLTALMDGRTLTVVSAFDNRIFLIGMDTLSLKATYSFQGMFGFGSILAVSPDGVYGYISSTSTGEVIKFDIDSGNEVGRLKNLLTPAQITITHDGRTLLVVDTSANEVVFVDSSSMTEKYRMTAGTEYSLANFTIFNKAVLNLDESYGVIGSQDASSLAGGSLLFFKTSTGEIVRIEQVGYQPGFTALLPDGSAWVVLCQDQLSVASTSNIPLDENSESIVKNSATVRGNPLGSANIVFSPDSKSAFYASSVADLVFQHNLNNYAVVGSFLVGDDPNEFTDQASSLALTPDEKTLVVLEFTSNELDLLTDETVFRQTKFISQQDKFTGLTVTNLSDRYAYLIITAIGDGGTNYSGTDVVNPVGLQLWPNAQASLELGELFNLDNDQNNSGRVVIRSDQPAVAGFSTTGQIRAEFLGAYVSGLQGIPLFPHYGGALHDWIIPEIPQESNSSAELNFVNPNYNQSNYDWTHYGIDGAVLETRTGSYINGSIREVNSVSNLLTSTRLGQVLVVGGFDATSTKETADLFDRNSKTFSITGARPTPRQGHSATWLNSGKVLIAGGKKGVTVLNTAALYDPISNSFLSTAGTMNWDRYRHTATALINGKVLLAGGQNSSSINASAELFDPISLAFESTAGFMTTARDAHTATLLPDGKVLIAGGIDGYTTSETAELYDPASSLFGATGPMSARRAFHTAVRLTNGKVLIAGGYNGEYLNSAELYNPETGLFSSTAPMNVERSSHTCTLLSDGTVLIVGGMNSSGPLNSAELYNPITGIFVPVGEMTSARTSHTATLMPDGSDHANDRVLIAGGWNYEDDEKTTLNTAEFYDPVTLQFTAISGIMTDARQGHSATLLQGVEGGYLRMTSPEGLLFTEIFNFGYADTGLNGINMDKYAGITRIYSPQFAVLPPFETILNIINGNQDSEATVTITLHAQDGAILGTPVIRILPQNGQIRDNIRNLFQENSNLQNQTGWLEVTSSVDRIVGTVSFTNADNSFLASFELSGLPLNDFLFPLVSEDGDFRTGVALLNGNDQTAHVQLELWGPAGTLDGYTSISLAPMTRTAKYLSDYFPGIQPHHSANLRVHSDRPLHGLAILHDWGLRFISSVPPAPFPEQ